MNLPEPSPEFWSSPAAYIFGALAVAAILIAIVRSRRPSRLRATLTAMAEERVREDNTTRCPCGEVATEPAPTIKRGRGGIAWLRDYYGMPPMWTRETDRFRPNVFCSSHAHVADEMTNQSLLDIRAKYAALNVETAAVVAGFEQEKLLQKIGDSLTDNQKAERKRAQRGTELRAVPSLRTGTEDKPGS
jgi:hypothetical protein